MIRATHYVLAAALAAGTLAFTPGTAKADKKWKLPGGWGNLFFGDNGFYYPAFSGYPYSGYSGFAYDPFSGTTNSFHYPYGYSGYNPAPPVAYPRIGVGNPPEHSSYYRGPGDDSMNQLKVGPVPANVVQIRATLPTADAQVWVEGVEMSSRGTTRILESPELAPDRSYNYTIRATWKEGDRVVTGERKLAVTPGKLFAVDFTQPAPEKMPAPK